MFPLGVNWARVRAPVLIFEVPLLFPVALPVYFPTNNAQMSTFPPPFSVPGIFFFFIIVTLTSIRRFSRWIELDDGWSWASFVYPLSFVCLLLRISVQVLGPFAEPVICFLANWVDWTLPTWWLSLEAGTLQDMYVLHEDIGLIKCVTLFFVPSSLYIVSTAIGRFLVILQVFFVCYISVCEARAVSLPDCSAEVGAWSGFYVETDYGVRSRGPVLRWQEVKSNDWFWFLLPADMACTSVSAVACISCLTKCTVQET